VVQEASRKAVFPREIAKYLDVAVYVLDTRAPLATFHIERELKAKRLFLLAKADIADGTETNRWLKFFHEREVAAFPFVKDEPQTLSPVRGFLSSVLTEKTRQRTKRGIRETTLRVVVLGVPNTGKSTVINRLVGRRKAATGDRPGITRGYSWVRILDGVELLDTPGILREYVRVKRGRAKLMALRMIPEEAALVDDAVATLLSAFGEHNWAKLQKFYRVGEKVQKMSAAEVIAFVGRVIEGPRWKDALAEQVGYRIIADANRGRFGRFSLETVAVEGQELAELLEKLEEQVLRARRP